MSGPANVDGFEEYEFEGRPVLVSPVTGPAVIVIHEIPGITPEVARFGRAVRDAGFTVWMPLLLGDIGRESSARYMATSSLRMCVSREFHVLARNETSPVVDRLRRLARHAAERCGPPGVGVVGMCFSGGFGLAMATEAAVVAPVLSQPSLPVALVPRRSAALGISPTDLDVVCRRDIEVLGLRFTGDKLVPDTRFKALEAALGARFHRFDITSPDPANGIAKNAHSVLARDFQDRTGHPTKAAFDTVLEFLRRHLPGEQAH